MKEAIMQIELEIERLNKLITTYRKNGDLEMLKSAEEEKKEWLLILSAAIQLQ
jgi:hypothetical protein